MAGMWEVETSQARAQVRQATADLAGAQQLLGSARPGEWASPAATAYVTALETARGALTALDGLCSHAEGLIQRAGLVGAIGLR
jgi:hypothetical protein